MTRLELIKKYKRRKILSEAEAVERRKDIHDVLASRTVRPVQIAKDLAISRQRLHQIIHA